MRLIAVFLSVFLVCAVVPSDAQPPAPVTLGGVTFTGSFRTRLESWNWFDQTAAGSYSFLGSIARISAKQSHKRFDWQFELAAPFLLELPPDAIASGAQGQLGLGATYYAANGNDSNVGHVFAKQAFVRLKGSTGAFAHALTLGRMEFVDGSEATPSNATLAAVKRDRIAHRLLGTFAFSHVGRSMDGVWYSGGGPRTNVTGLASRPTDGVFQVNGWDELNVDVFYGAFTRQLPGTSHAGEWRAFVLGYRDGRHDVLKTDNRPVAARRADTGTIAITTFGGHYLGSMTTTAGAIDVLAWGALQTGSWGALSQRAGAFAVEGGWQPTWGARAKPWLRGGWDYGSGDGDPADGRHGTFFQVLPTPRVYARFPFYNMMNNSDAFGELVLRPSPKITARADIHALHLSNANDLWYQGGGAFQAGTFGYQGRPSNGSTDFAMLYDAGADLTVNPRASVGIYYGFAGGGSVVTGTYPAGGDGRFGYMELTLRF
jgi:hypothetical protein